MRDGFHHLECERIGEGVVVRGEHRSTTPDEIRIKAYPSGDGRMVVLNEARMGSIPMTAATGRALAAAIVAACEKVEEGMNASSVGA